MNIKFIYTILPIPDPTGSDEEVRNTPAIKLQ
jgi:hypothetical protein